MHRILAIGLITALVLIGALHYPPLWAFVILVPLWLRVFLQTEERRIRAEAVERLREKLLRSWTPPED